MVTKIIQLLQYYNKEKLNLYTKNKDCLVPYKKVLIMQKAQNNENPLLLFVSKMK